MADSSLSDSTVEADLVHLDELLGALEQMPGPTAETALEAVSTLARVYGTALERVMSYASGSQSMVEALRRDELLSHLLALHDVHPDPIEVRVGRALDEVRPYIHSHGGEVELDGVADGVVRVKLTGSCTGCSGSTTTLHEAVSTAVLSVAPEVLRVEQIDAQPVTHGPPPQTVIPIESLRARAGAR